jgi:hypothetical protein
MDPAPQPATAAVSATQRQNAKEQNATTYKLLDTNRQQNNCLADYPHAE